jgi:hypothetical protein
MASCSQVPFPTTYGLNTQKKMQAAHHWDVLASDVSEQVKISLQKKSELKKIPTFISSSDTTPFGKIFHNLLVTHLVQKGIVVSNVDKDAITMKYEAKVLEHTNRIVREPPVKYSVLALGIRVARDVADWTSRNILNLGVGLGALADYGRGFTTGDLPNKEVVITTSLVLNDQYIMHKSDIYYINEFDEWHYEKDKGPKTYRVVN